VHVAEHTVTTDAESQRLGMRGSPTLLIDGRDPFPAPGARPALSCRIYRGEDGTADGAPTPAQLEAALGDG
jgi:hypothetical protein